MVLNLINLLYWLVKWTVSWLVSLLISYWIDQLSNWLDDSISLPVVWLIDKLTGLSVKWLYSYWSNRWFIVSLVNSSLDIILTDRLIGWLVYWLISWSCFIFLIHFTGWLVLMVSCLAELLFNSLIEWLFLCGLIWYFKQHLTDWLTGLFNCRFIVSLVDPSVDRFYCSSCCL